MIPLQAIYVSNISTPFILLHSLQNANRNENVT